MSRRTRIEIIHDMLRAIQNKGGSIKPTHLMYKANLSHKLLNTYLEDLLSNDMVEKVQKKKNYQYLMITDKGHDFINEFGRVKKLQETFGI